MSVESHSSRNRTYSSSKRELNQLVESWSIHSCASSSEGNPPTCSAGQLPQLTSTNQPVPFRSSRGDISGFFVGFIM